MEYTGTERGPTRYIAKTDSIVGRPEPLNSAYQRLN